MAEPFVGEIRMFGFQFAPTNWAFCSGQIMAISQNEALFALLGTTFGGDGQVSFGLPNLQSRVPVGMGQGLGLSNYSMGEAGGVENVGLTTQQMPAHTHNVSCTGTMNTSPTETSPVNNFWARENNGDAPYSSAAVHLNPMHPTAIANSGGSIPHTNIQPYLVINFCIALYGIFPTRN